MVILKVHALTNDAIEAKKNLKDQMESWAITDANYSIELMKLLNGYREKLQHILDRNYHYLFTQD